jgi:hypothetical protein
MMKYTEFGQKRLPVITSHLTVTVKLKLSVMLKKKRGIWKGTQIMFYKAVMVPTLTCSGHTTCRGSELFGAGRLCFL